MPEKIVLITTGQPSTNPRIVKEADALQRAGFDVTMIYCFMMKWAADADIHLLNKAKWKYLQVGGAPDTSKFLYLFTKARHKIFKILNRFLGNRYPIPEYTEARCYYEMLSSAKRINADWYIGHNLGALSVAVNAAKHNHAKAGFDFEDFHSLENLHRNKYDQRRIEFIEKKYVSSLDNITASSSMIAERISKGFSILPPVVLLNCFPLAQQPPFTSNASSDKLDLFWFSQTVGPNRGLEILINVLNEINDPFIHLTLAGNCSNEYRALVEDNAGNILQQVHFAGTIHPDDLPAFSSGFDVGLALELSVPENHNICLANKIFVYMLAGNAVILSETAMQKKFNDENRVGLSFKNNDKDGLKLAILEYRNNREALNKQKQYNYKLALTKYNWEMESPKLISSLTKS